MLGDEQKLIEILTRIAEGLEGLNQKMESALRLRSNPYSEPGDWEISKIERFMLDHKRDYIRRAEMEDLLSISKSAACNKLTTIPIKDRRFVRVDYGGSRGSVLKFDGKRPDPVEIEEIVRENPGIGPDDVRDILWERHGAIMSDIEREVRLAKIAVIPVGGT